MTAPRWILDQIQPLAVKDVLRSSRFALDQWPTDIVEVGAEALTFKAMLMEYANVRKFKRLIAPVPVLAPKLAGLWVGLVTPIPRSMASPLIDGILYPLLANTEKARRLFPHVTPMPYRKAVMLALESTLNGSVDTRWSGALGNEYPAYQLERRRRAMREVRTLWVRASPVQVYQTFSSLGGETGWLVWDWAWKARGLSIV